MKPGLYIVATPIGNLGDITLRALECLKSVDFVASEDTRITRRLTDFYQIKCEMISLNARTESQKINYILDRIAKWRVMLPPYRCRNTLYLGSGDQTCKRCSQKRNRSYKHSRSKRSYSGAKYQRTSYRLVHILRFFAQ